MILVAILRSRLSVTNHITRKRGWLKRCKTMTPCRHVRTTSAQRTKMTMASSMEITVQTEAPNLQWN